MSVKLAVLAAVIAGPHGDATAVSIWEDVREAAAYRSGITVLAPEELDAIEGTRLDSALKECGSDTMCLTERVHESAVPLAVACVLNFALDPPFMSLQLVDGEKRKLAAKSIGRIDTKKGTVSAAIRAAVAKLLAEAGYTEGGRLIVETMPPHAHVEVIGAAVDPADSPATMVVPPGVYDVRAVLPGYVEVKQPVTVAAGKDARLSIPLVRETSLVESPWLWGAVGAAVVGGVLAGVLIATQGPTEGCVVLPGAGCPAQ